LNLRACAEYISRGIGILKVLAPKTLATGQIGHNATLFSELFPHLLAFFSKKEQEEIKMKTINICIALAVMIFLGGCAVTDIESTKDFSAYRTFGFGEPDVEVKDPAYNSGLIDARIKNAVREEFGKRGISYEADSPDLIVTYRTYTEEKTSTNNYPYPYSYPYMMSPYSMYAWRFGYWGYPGMFGWGYPYGGYGGRSYNYTQGRLIIDINDRLTGEHVWRGMVSGNVSNPSTLQKQLDKAVKAILKKYPVTPQQELMKVPGHDEVS
jgi:hypothetical protein